MNMLLHAVYFLGIVLFFIQILLYEYKHSRIFTIIEGLLSIIPVFGTILQCALFSLRVVTASLPCDNSHNSKYITYPRVRNNKVNRWLFNKLDWEYYDVFYNVNYKK